MRTEAKASVIGVRDAIEDAIAELQEWRTELPEAEEEDGLTLSPDEILAEAISELDEMLQKANNMVRDLNRLGGPARGGNPSPGA